MKTCKKCNEPKSLDNYSNDKSKKDGLNSRCRSCCSKAFSNYLSKPENKERVRNNVKEHQLLNPEYYKQKDKENYENNKDLWKVKNKIYKSENRNKINQSLRIKYQEDTIYRTKRLIISLISSSFRNNGFTKNPRSYQILGCTFEEFKQYLESKFEPWMTWENQGLYNGELNYGWDIDHIIPISSAKTEEDIIRLNHYTNFQPLCSYTNRYIKINKINYERRLHT